MVENRIVAEVFEVKAFRQALTEAAGSDKVPIARQVLYLARYCRRLGAATVVREEHYIDRHFLDEHALYYSRSLGPPPNHVRRFHLFSRAFSDVEFSELLERCAMSAADAREVERDLTKDYLGFVSIRPLPAVPIGRTVLRRLDDGESRDIWATSAHTVHLANLTLGVNGLAFQQQDLAVGACATAAVWSALSRVTRHEGMRAPTPAEVSQAAGRHVLSNGRTVPAVAGLNVEQLCEAIRSSGFAPEVVSAFERPELFVVALHTYLLSGIPVVLMLASPTGRHAVTAVGFQCGAEARPLLSTSVPVRSARVNKLYVHDDGLGPYARAFLRPLPATDEFSEALLLDIEQQRDDGEDKAAAVDDDIAEPHESGETPPGHDALTQSAERPGEWLLVSAIAPVYPKLRLPARSLITLAELLGDLIEHIVGEEEAVNLSVEFYYERSGDYLSKLPARIGSAGAPAIAGFLRAVALSRWCGIVRWFLRETPLVEFVYDTTDILRDENRLGAELLRAVVCLDPGYRVQVAKIATIFPALSI